MNKPYATTETHPDGSFTVLVAATPKMSSLAATEMGWAEARKTDPAAVRTAVGASERPDESAWTYSYTFTPRR